jgi:signal transduction histidine kinase/DNA-binding response OmpR family regulator
MKNERTLVILIVDDFAPDRELYYRYLGKENRANYKIIEAETGEGALATIQASGSDLILLDYHLPDLDGLEFIIELKSQNIILPPIIMLTGQGDEQIAVKAMKSGVKDYLVKGNLTGDILRNSVYGVLRQEHLQNLLIKNKKQQQLIAEIALRIRQSVDLQDIFNTTVAEAQKLINCDRAVIYRFNRDLSGDIVAESVKPGWYKSLGLNIIDTYFQTQGTTKYRQEHFVAISDIRQANLSSCHLQLLEKFEVKANLIVPILLYELPYLTLDIFPSTLLWGLFIVHECSDIRVWKEDEIELLNKLAVQFAIVVQQAELIENLKSELDKRERAEISLMELCQKLEWANHKMSETAECLKQRNQELDEFAYVASHDLKAPLRAIANLANWLSEDLNGTIPEENQHQLDLLQSRVKRMEQLIQGLLTYSRIGRQAAPQETINVADLIAETIDFLSPPPEFIIEIAPEMPTLTTDKLALHQVFSNLIGNAIKYHPRHDGKIIISVGDRETFYQFAVKDDGRGIAPEYHQKIFGIFQTLQSRDEIESTGIGLSIVKKIVEFQGGEITLESQIDRGTTFYFTWKKN